MAAGTAAGLVPIRSITRRASSGLPEHARVSAKDGEETVTYIAEGNEEPGELCIKLLTQLKGIQAGKVEDQFGWRCEIAEEDAKRVVGETAAGNGSAQTVDQLD
jgi:branched-chain amino acid aminotransferase